MMKQWYEKLFENYAAGYDRETFTQGTLQEVDFLEQEFVLNTSLKVLDIACGTGRHAVELAKRGYTVTGVDFSPAQLTRAQQKAAAAGVSISFVQGDARDLPYSEEFDIALLLCEGAFPLMETDEMNFRILQGARRALRSPGKLILTTLNALYPLAHSAEVLRTANTSAIKIAQGTFDVATFRMTSVFTVTDDNGVEQSLTGNERYYTPSEIAWLLRSLGYSHIAIYGCTPGRFTTEKEITAGDYEMLVIACC